MTLLRDKVKTIEDTMLETLKNKKGKSKQNQLIEDTIELRAEVLKLIAQKKAMALKKEYPEFEEKKGISGIFSKLKDIGKNILNGVVTRVLDTASLGYGGNVYKQLVDGKSDEEKVKIESRLIAFQKKVAEIDSWLVDELNSLRHEGCHRLASANEADKQKLEEFKRNIESKEREIDQEMEVFVPEQHAD